MTIHTSRMKTAITAGFLITALAGGNAPATPIDPGDASLSLLGALPGGDLSINTGISGDSASLPILSYGGGTLFGDVVSQSGGPDIAVFRFAGDSVFGAGNLLTVTGGSRPLALLFNGAVSIEGTIDASGTTGGSGGYKAVGGRGIGVAGGGNGGYGGPFSGEDGAGPGGGSLGGSSASASGVGPGAGGGFGMDGGNGGAGLTNVTGGAVYGDPLSNILLGGSGGGGGGGQCCVGSIFYGGSGGGAGGGAIEIGALTRIDLVDASIFANGGDGGSGNRNGGGGGGGGILLHAYDISLDAASLLQANGGSGGMGAVQGGCGGAGRIEVLTNTNGSFSNTGTAEAAGYGTCASGALMSMSLDTIGMAPTQNPPASSVPEPKVLSLIGLGLAGIGVFRRK